jgi:hypothetical protein
MLTNNNCSNDYQLVVDITVKVTSCSALSIATFINSHDYIDSVSPYERSSLKGWEQARETVALIWIEGVLCLCTTHRHRA